MKNKVGHTSSTFLNSCFFQRYRPLSPVKFGNFNDHPLTIRRTDIVAFSTEILKLNLFTKFSNGFMVSFMLLLSSGVVVERLRLDSGFSVIFKWTVSEI